MIECIVKKEDSSETIFSTQMTTWNSNILTLIWTDTNMVAVLPLRTDSSIVYLYLGIDRI